MKREEIKTYKDACKVIGRKPRTYKNKHLNLNSLVQLQLLLTLLVTITNLGNPSLIIITSILGYIEEVDIINLRVCSV